MTCLQQETKNLQGDQENARIEGEARDEEKMNVEVRFIEKERLDKDQNVAAV